MPLAGRGSRSLKVSLASSVLQQVELYLVQHDGRADPNALYILEGGGNDILDTPSGSPELLGLRIAEGIARGELLLREAGAKHFVIPDLLNVGLLPAAAGHVGGRWYAERAVHAGLVANTAASHPGPFGFLRIEFPKIV